MKLKDLPADFITGALALMRSGHNYVACPVCRLDQRTGGIGHIDRIVEEGGRETDTFECDRCHAVFAVTLGPGFKAPPTWKTA